MDTKMWGRCKTDVEVCVVTSSRFLHPSIVNQGINALGTNSTRMGLGTQSHAGSGSYCGAGNIGAAIAIQGSK